jgi:hypothetical protein
MGFQTNPNLLEIPSSQILAPPLPLNCPKKKKNHSKVLLICHDQRASVDLLPTSI